MGPVQCSSRPGATGARARSTGSSRAGFAVASIDYRLSGEAVFPAQLEDAHASVRWLRGRAGELGVDATRIVAWGESAGAHLAALLGLTGGRRDADGPSGAVAGVVDWYGAADLTTMAAQAMPTGIARSDEPDSRESQLLGVPVGQAPELARRASPVSHVHQGAPPFHIAHGDVDRFVPVRTEPSTRRQPARCGRRGRVHGGARRRSLWMNAPDPEAIFGSAMDFSRRVTASRAP